MARRGRGRARGRGRPKKKVIESDDDEQIIETSEAIDNLVEIPEEPKNDPEENVISHSGHGASKKHAKEQQVEVESSEEVMTPTKCDYNIDDISQLIAPTFSTVNRAPLQPMIDLDWDQKYTSLGEKIQSPNVHFCEICRLPVRIYGRMIPCKHIFCLKCACDCGTKCYRCGDKVHRVETSQLGSVFMCSHEGSRYGFDGCRRTYLSQRDLQAHINHRHKPRSGLPSPGVSSSNVPAADTSQRSGSFSRSPYGSTHSPRSNLVPTPAQTGTRGSKYGTSPEMPSSSTRYERRASRSSQNQHEASGRNKWNFR